PTFLKALSIVVSIIISPLFPLAVLLLSLPTLLSLPNLTIYCNSRFYGLPELSLHRLQLVQNALARVVVPTVRRSHHISPTLRSLHWLPIPQRITFKIASITFKTLQNKQPSYLRNLLIPYCPPHSLPSPGQHLLSVPFFKSSQARRSFLFAAPTIWNSLPLALRSTSSSTSFHSALKTHLFPPLVLPLPLSVFEFWPDTVYFSSLCHGLGFLRRWCSPSLS